MAAEEATAVPTEEAAEEPTAVPTEEPAEEPTAVPTEEPAEEPTTVPTEEPAEEPTAVPTEEPAEEPTAVPTEEPAEEPTAVPTEEPAEEPTAVPTEEPAEEPTAVPTEEPAEEATAVDTATVLVPSLRIRSGPGTTFEVIGGAVQGERYGVTGQAADCEWLQIAHPQLGVAWIGGGVFAAIDGDCAAIPAVDPASSESGAATAPTTADPVATPTPATLQPTPVPAAESAPTAVATAAPVEEAAPAADAGEADPFPADKGCMLLQNQLGPELTFTFTSDDGSFNETVQVTSDADVPYCLDPGSYRVTVDAPPPWADINEEFTIAAGDRFFFPIRPQ
jgi:serine protease Do